MRILLICLLFLSCSTMKKTIIYSSLIGGVSVAATGALLSPNKESASANAAVFGLIGAGVVALAGYALYEDDPRNYQLKNMLLSEKKEQRPDEIDIGLGNLNIEANLQKVEGYKVPLTELPEKLRGKVNQQYLIKYQSKEQYVKNGTQTYYIPPFEIYEHSYDEQLGDGYGKQE
ncbi:MAG: hypothetical protein A2504_17010 [Bdellovibrionales bacterium RIFOXYD12_FULL_39_22]|nr:MAG: hypothetical protein A2385_17835 [Bdellovibrionales bacterium RIFOXYB1_FULL_39_21]OFZ44034.1 MAG: hypothetical protein A2485_14970 [Bdellovibrionales bacterium RIFOXYC12_FULL_39_17]OFZ48287.1 MAG: hypothetical protein A2404_08700 [Bdellovibrionales bacterium RIFOXYC1_FULL_39_130]OFZ76615.1 MAG: hypothetical protein A2560_17780 [Bdellovibrionales bacterium RIFOXYD1_FULL_39_84]OFZ76967.1 MAG: hypothetical protein A2451_11300 [Bdellovibrionales bacterium RIFOXYC2_FULL_39_8]OFZ95536.1 MAG: